MTRRTIAEVWRDYSSDGVPSTGAHRPINADIRDTLQGELDDLESQIVATGSGRKFVASVVARTIGNVDLAGGGLANGTTHDDVTVSTGERVLVMDNTAKSEHGIYIVPASGAATRASDANTAAEFVNANGNLTTTVENGTLYGDTDWTVSNTSAPVVGTDDITFVLTRAASGSGLAGRVEVLETDVAGLTTHVQRMGVPGTPVTDATKLGGGNVAFSTPALRAGNIGRVLFRAEAAGDFVIRVWTQTESSFTATASYTYTVSGAGDYDLDATTFGTLAVAEGQLVGFSCPSNMIPRPAGTIGYWYQSGSSATSFTDSTYAQDFAFQVAIEVHADADLADTKITHEGEISRLQEKVETLLDYLGDEQTIGSAATPAAGTGNGAAGTYVTVDAAEDDGVLESIVIYSGVTTFIDIAVAETDAAGVHTVVGETRRYTVTASQQNTFTPELPILKGQRLWLAGGVAGFITYLTASNDGYFYDTYVAGQDGAFTDTLETTNAELQFQATIRKLRPPLEAQAMFEQVSQTQVVGKTATPATGSNSTAGTYVYRTPVAATTVETKVEIYAGATATVRIHTRSKSGDTFTESAVLRTVTVKAGLNTFYIRKRIPAGQYIGFRSATNGFCTFIATAEEPYYNTAAVDDAPFVDAAVATGVQLQIRVTFTQLGEQEPLHEMTLAKVGRFKCFGPSYQGGYYQLPGGQYLGKFSQWSDWNVETFALSGERMYQQLDRYRDNSDPWSNGVGARDLKAQVIFVEESYNSAHNSGGPGTVAWADYVEDVRQFLETANSQADLVMMAGGWKASYDYSEHTAVRNLCEDYGAVFVDVWGHARLFNSGTRYGGFWGDTSSGSALANVEHPGQRTAHLVSDPLERFVNALAPIPDNFAKIYRVRSAVTVSDIDDDLMFQDRWELCQRFKEIDINHATIAPADYDYVDDLTPSGAYSHATVRASEYLELQTGGTITVAEDYLLLRIGINSTRNGCSYFTMTVPDGLTVYVRDVFAGDAYPADGASVARWTALTPVGGSITLSGDELDGKMDFDCLTFLFEGSGGFDFSMPTWAWRGREGKTKRPKTALLKPTSGTSVLSVNTIVDGSATGWTLTGSPTISTDTTYQLPYGITRFTTLSTSKKLSQALNLSADFTQTRELEIEIWARNFPTPVGAGSTFPDDYPFTIDSFDWSRVIVELVETGGTYAYERRLPVGLWWNRLLMRTIMPIGVAAPTLRISSEADTVQFAAAYARII